MVSEMVCALSESYFSMTNASSHPEHLRQRIRELEQTLQTKQEEMALLQAILDGIPDVIYATDTQGFIRVANTAFSAWAGRPHEEILHKRQQDLFPEDLVATWKQQMEMVQSTGQPLVVEEKVVEGTTTRTFLSQRFPLLNAQGEIHAIFGMASDISDRKQVEEALRENQRILRAIIDNAPAVIYVKSPDGQLMIVNQLYGKVIGHAVEDIVGKNESEIFPAELISAWRESERHLFEQGQPVQYQNVMYVDAVPHDFLTTQFPLYDDDHKPYAVCGISTDVTELRKAEREHAALQGEIIAAQQAALRELQTPLIPLADGVLVMPLIGAMDDIRAQQVMETLLHGVATYNATVVILDVTGLTVADTHVVSVLLQTTKAARLLGAEMILTGVGPEIAQTLISIGIDFGGIKTPGTLQSGIAYALQGRASYQ